MEASAKTVYSLNHRTAALNTHRENIFLFLNICVFEITLSEFIDLGLRIGPNRKHTPILGQTLPTNPTATLFYFVSSKIV